jgi:Protein of unknown function (DUF2975).
MKALGKRSVASFLAILLNVIWYVVAIGTVLMACVAVAALAADVRKFQMDLPVSFSVNNQILSSDLAQPGGEAARVKNVRARGSLTFAPPSGTFLATTAATLAVLFALGLWVLGHLRAVFRTLRQGRPFVPANATRIRWIGYAVILAEVVRTAVVFVANSYAMTHFAAAGLRFDARPDFHLLAVVHGLIILVIAEVFRAGTQLDEDQSLTV